MRMLPSPAFLALLASRTHSQPPGDISWRQLHTHPYTTSLKRIPQPGSCLSSGAAAGPQVGCLTRSCGHSRASDLNEQPRS